MIKGLIPAILILFFHLNLSVAQTVNLSSVEIEQMKTQVINAISTNNLSLAKMVLQRLLIKAAGDATVQTLAGIAADRENNLAEAEKHFALAVKISPNVAETRNNYGAILLKLNRRPEAARQFLASLKINPNQPSALVNLAQIRFNENNLAEARQLFEKAEAIKSETPILRALVLISVQLKDKNRLTADFNKYFTKLKSEPFSANSLNDDIYLGKLLLTNGLTNESKELLEFILTNEAANIEALFSLSQIYLQKGEIPAAGKLLESAVKNGLEDARIYAALAEVYQRGGYFENAVPAMRLAIEKDPQNELYYARYGLLLVDARAPVAAIMRLNEAAKLFPRSAKILLALAIAQISQGENAGAKITLENALAIEPDSVPIMAYLADVLVGQSQYIEALKIYKRAVNIEENAVLHYLIADTMLKIPESNPAEIQSHLLKSISLDEKLAQAHFTLGKLYARDNLWEKANTEFEKATRYAPEMAEAFYQYGRTLARLKRTDESKNAFEMYKKLNETNIAKKENDRQELVRRLANVRF